MESEIHKTHHALKTGKTTCAGLMEHKIKELEESPINTATYLLADSAMEAAM